VESIEWQANIREGRKDWAFDRTPLIRWRDWSQLNFVCLLFNCSLFSRLRRIQWW